MNKNFKFFAIIWLILLVVFNAVTFLVPNDIFGETRFDTATFWIGYSLVIAGFILQIVTAFLFCKNDNGEKMFLHIPLLINGYIALGVSFVVGTIFTIIATIAPAWIGGIVSIVITAYFVIAAIVTDKAASAVSGVDKKVKAQTEFIRIATVDAENIVARANTAEIKAEAKKVYEAIRYSDPMSNAALARIEVQISDKLEELKTAVDDANDENVKAVTSDILLLVKERNSKCKALK